MLVNHYFGIASIWRWLWVAKVRNRLNNIYVNNLNYNLRRWFFIITFCDYTHIHIKNYNKTSSRNHKILLQFSGYVFIVYAYLK